MIDNCSAIALAADDVTFDDQVETVTLTELVSEDYHSVLIRLQDSDGLSSGGSTVGCYGTRVLGGYLVDATTNQPLSGVTIEAGGLTAVTDAIGYYVITGPACGTHEVVVSVPGFETYRRTFNWFAGGWLDIRLTKESIVNGLPPATGVYGDPVNTATGNYVYQRRHLEIPGIGLSFQFDRAYNSREASRAGAAGAPLGYGWSHSYDARLGIDAGIVTITWGDGRTETCSPDGFGGYTTQYGVFDTLTDKVAGETVSIEVVTTDRYGRTVGKVWLDRRDINRELVAEGHAWVYRKYMTDENLLEDERAAREAGLGLWGLPETERMPPWEWRKERRR